MIGILCRPGQAQTVQEFFELFKTPWEMATPGQSYDVVVATVANNDELPARFSLLYSPGMTANDSRTGVTVAPALTRELLALGGQRIPIYSGLAALAQTGNVLLRSVGDEAAAAIVVDDNQRRVLRVGYDLFAEVAHLLLEGQRPTDALVPCLDCHVALLRSFIAGAGLPIVEMPPVRCGHSFIACLTHDVDFIGIRQHRLDHTFWGFVQRALVGSVRNITTSMGSWDQLGQNWGAVAALPLVYAGLRPDPWDQFEHYGEIEGEQPSTFFLIPFKESPGQHVPGKLAARRATRYDVDDIKPQIQRLIERGCEIGVHGLDAWHSVEKGCQELERIVAATGQDRAGVRIHWLCCDGKTPGTLEEAGFDYDSTCGYNDAVGYKAGTGQVFRPPGASRLLELPLHIQDTALFYPGRMGLTKAQAWERCLAILDAAGRYGGVVTVLWHLRSLAPERLWGDFYVRLLQELRQRGAWLATAGQAVDWFRQRRAVTFEQCQIQGNSLHLTLRPNGATPASGLVLRVTRPQQTARPDLAAGSSWLDIPWTGEARLAIPLD